MHHRDREVGTQLGTGGDNSKEFPIFLCHHVLSMQEVHIL